jgi:hypothetical protein
MQYIKYATYYLKLLILNNINKPIKIFFGFEPREIKIKFLKPLKICKIKNIFYIHHFC